MSTKNKRNKLWASEANYKSKNFRHVASNAENENKARQDLLDAITNVHGHCHPHLKRGLSRGVVERRKDCWAVWSSDGIRNAGSCAVWMVSFDGHLIRFAARGHHPKNGFAHHLDSSAWRTEPTWSTLTDY